MGSCLGHCRLGREGFSLYRFYSKANDAVDIQINDLISEEHILDTPQPFLEEDSIKIDRRFEYEPKRISFGRPDDDSSRQSCRNIDQLKSLFSNIRRKSDASPVLKLELLEDELSMTEGDYSARTESLVIQSSAKLGKEKHNNSASLNSLDLEWEHLPEMAVFSTSVVDKEEPQSATSVGAWSRLSSADSLEWDSAEVEMKDEIDTETEQLIQEIEMLSLKTLQETQEWAS